MLHDANRAGPKASAARGSKPVRSTSIFRKRKSAWMSRGRVARIEKVENDISHQLIEEYMLLANEAVAARLMSLNRPAVYRVHEAPDEKRLQEYREEVLSHHIPCGNLSNRHEVQKLLHKLGTLAIGQALKIGFLKSLMRARYAVEPLGHYGLAKKKYTALHLAHPPVCGPGGASRAVSKAANGPATHPLKQTADHISDTERNSADAERDSKDVKLFAFLEAQLESPSPQRLSGAGDGCAQFRLLCRCARTGA